jgi:hypothetical protein
VNYLKSRTLHSRWLVLPILFGVLFLVASVALAQLGGPYDLSWNTVDGGGGTASGGPYRLTGTAGQIDPGVLAGGPYTLAGAFWKGGVLVDFSRAYLPLVLRSRP